MQGIIIFLKTFLGTKSESLQPFLYLGNGKTVRVYKKGDNPFENESLQQYDGKDVLIIGEMNEKNVFEIDNISSKEQSEIDEVNIETKYNEDIDEIGK